MLEMPVCTGDGLVVTVGGTGRPPDAKDPTQW